MAVTLFHRIINRNYLKVVIHNGKKKPQKKALNVKSDIRSTRHTISEEVIYD